MHAKTAFGSRLIGAALGLITVGVATADVDKDFPAPGQWTISISHVPDFDQRRALLPGTGSQYCVPTAVMNWMGYFAAHGLPWLPPGVADWEDAVNYNFATSQIGLMGELMGTDENTGTTGSGAENGIDAWLPDNLFVVVHQYNENDWSPKIADLAFHGFLGAYVVPVVGWYQGTPPNITRGGGHALSMTYAERNGSSYQIGWRDPAADEGLVFVQSPFATETYDVVQMNAMPNGLPARPMSRVTNYGSAWIDEMFAFYPQFALTTIPELNDFAIHFAINLFGDDDPTRTFVLGPDSNLIDITMHTDLTSLIYIAERGEGPEIWRLDQVFGDAERISVPEVTSPSRLKVSRRRDLYVIDDDFAVSCINIDIPIPEETVRQEPPFPVSALAYDDSRDEVVLISTAGRKMLRYPWHLDAAPAVQDLPGTTPVEGRVTIACDPGRDGVWLVSEASDSLFLLTTDPFTGQLVDEEVIHPEVTNPTAVDVGDSGRVFVSAIGSIWELENDGAGWAAPPDPLFPDLTAGPFFEIARSRSNFDPEMHTGPAWDHVLPDPDAFGDSVLDCHADLDGDGVIGFSDLLLMLAGWGPCPPDAYCDADLDLDGVIGFNDLLLVLASWGPCAQ